MTSPILKREYALLATRVGLAGGRAERMQRLVDVLWDGLHATGVSWIGFYLPDTAGQLVLGPRRNKPACSPIGMHGACGRSFTSLAPLIVRDVRDLGSGYIACDPRDQSEIVLPLLEPSGACWGVLDLDSHALGAFDEADVAGLSIVLRAAGLTT